jgi:hypothetical protein
VHSEYALLANVVVAAEGATLHDIPHFAGGVVPGDGIFTTWSYRWRRTSGSVPAQSATSSGACRIRIGSCRRSRAEREAVSRTRELADLYLRPPEATRRNTRVHFIHPLKERLVREVGYGLSLEGASAADLVKSMQAKSGPVAQKGKVA